MKVYGRENCIHESEKTFFEWLQKLDTKKLKNKLSFAVANVRPENPYGPDIEIDFLLVGEAGILAIEVKGGIISINDDGVWCQYQKPMMDPFAQAANNFYALMDFLKSKKAIGSDNGYYACAFPMMAISQPLSHLYPNTLYLDKRFADAPELFIDDIFEYNYKKHGKKQLTELEVENVRKLLAPNYDYYIRDMANYTDEAVIKLSSEQLVILESLGHVNRLMVHGAPGSGKTVLAIEILAQQENSKSKTGYICYNKTLRNKVKHDLALKLGNEPEYVTICTLEETKNFKENEFEFVVLDEAQDFLNNDAFNHIDSILVNGLEKGRFRIFMSHEQDIFEQTEMMFMIELMTSETVVFCNLKYNYRNSSNIIDLVKKLTGLNPGEVHGNPQGLNVEIKHIPYDGITPDFDLYYKYINECLNSLLDEGFEPQDIILLTTNQLQRSSLSDSRIEKIKLKHGVKLTKPQDINWSDDLNKQGIAYGSPWILKGIDAKVVVCLDYYDSEKQQKSALVSLTRARSRLIVFVGNKIEI